MFVKAAGKNVKRVVIEDDDVARERELVHSRSIASLQLDNNLIIKYATRYS